jgi:hypothetical protein
MPTKIVTINNDFFKYINTPLKGYILGLVVFNKKDNDDMDNINVEIKLNNVKEHDNNMKCISYGYYNDLKEAEKIHYPYFNNIDMLLIYLNNIGIAKYTELSCISGIIELTITSKQIKEDIGSHINIKDCKYSDLSDFIIKCYNEDVNICNQFIKAYIEKYASIVYDIMNITFYNEGTANSIVKL